MSHKHALSLGSAIAINLNIMLGAGIFINTTLLAKTAGILGAAAYAVVGILLLPLIISFMHLVHRYNGGTFFQYAEPLHPALGFLASWSYFIAKLSSCALGIHIFTTLVQTIIPAIASVSALALDLGIIASFTALNLLHVRIGKSIQIAFIIGKCIPILFALLTCLALISSTGLTSTIPAYSSIATTVPFVLYAFTGFEASCSLSRSLKNPRKDGPRALLIAFLLGLSIVVAYQFLFYAALGADLGALPSFLQAFPALVSRFSLSQTAHTLAITILHTAIASSSLGAAYGIMFSNAWNLYDLAQKKAVIGHAILSTLNKHNVPLFCLLVEGCITSLYIIFSQGNQVPLQQISSLGMAITYTLSTLGLWYVWYKEGSLISTALLGLFSCVLLFSGFYTSVSTFGATPTLLFLSVLVGGLIMFFSLSRHHGTTVQPSHDPSH